jgi:hypothetical protein
MRTINSKTVWISRVSRAQRWFCVYICQRNYNPTYAARMLKRLNLWKLDEYNVE